MCFADMIQILGCARSDLHHEIKTIRSDVASWTTDGREELGKLAQVTRSCEIAIQLHCQPRVQPVISEKSWSTARLCSRIIARRVFGQTCDSLDRLLDGLSLPDDTRVGQYVMFAGLGAYSIAMSTALNGYGLRDVVTVHGLAGQCRAAD